MYSDERIREMRSMGRIAAGTERHRAAPAPGRMEKTQDAKDNRLGTSGMLKETEGSALPPESPQLTR